MVLTIFKRSKVVIPPRAIRLRNWKTRFIPKLAQTECKDRWKLFRNEREEHDFLWLGCSSQKRLRRRLEWTSEYCAWLHQNSQQWLQKCSRLIFKLKCQKHGVRVRGVWQSLVSCWTWLFVQSRTKRHRVEETR